MFWLGLWDDLVLLKALWKSAKEISSNYIFLSNYFVNIGISDFHSIYQFTY